MDGLQPQQVETLIRWLKEGPAGAIPLSGTHPPKGTLQAVTWEDAGDREALALLGRWHPPARTSRRWLVEQFLEPPGRLLFWVRNADGRAVGHLGLSCLDFTAGTVALEDFLCGEGEAGPMMNEAIEALRGWTREALRMEAVPGRLGNAA
jgi:hypothetical protein